VQITEAQAGHLAECAACNTQWGPHRALAAGLRSMAEEWREVEAPARVEAGLMAAFRSQSGFQGRGVFQFRRDEIRREFARSWWTPVFAWASAAAAMVALATVLVHGYQPPAKPGTVATPRHTAQPVMQVAAAVSPDTDSDDDAAVLGEGFVRLPNAQRIEANEDFNVVRVEVPGSAMIEAGISLSEDRAADTVLADVALASDGTPRAVRLVSDGGTY
jgi:negative regulator of sigma E activity